jgi:hypothetical protein
MANSIGATRTNYFRVIDEEKFEDIMDSVVANEDVVECWSKTKNGETYFAFGTIDDILGFEECSCEYCFNYKGTEQFDESKCEEYYDYNYDAFLEALQKVVHPDDAIIIVSSGYEKLRCVYGHANIITQNKIKQSSIWGSAIEKASEMLNNKEYNPETSY